MKKILTPEQKFKLTFLELKKSTISKGTYDIAQSFIKNDKPTTKIIKDITELEKEYLELFTSDIHVVEFIRECLNLRQKMVSKTENFKFLTHINQNEVLSAEKYKKTLIFLKKTLDFWENDIYSIFEEEKPSN